MHVPKGRLTRLLAGVAMIVAAGLAVPAPAGAAGDTGATENYLVVFKGNSSPKDAASIVTRAGGTVVANYAEIGVLVARSNNTAFGTTLRANNKVEGAAATTDFASRLAEPAAEGAGGPTGDLPNAPATDADTFSPQQWDMRQINAPEAHAISGGSREVLVGDIDTGIDFNHPDLQPNIDVANSVNCETGAPVPGLAAQDDNGHGTHTAGTIAAASNGIGIVGVAPNVRIAGIKAGNAAGYFFPEAVICGFVWAGSHHMDVTNNSYFVDPFLFNCRNDEVQRAIWKAVQRAVRYAMNEGVTVVAAEGNESEDLSHPTTDVTSPDFPPGSEQERSVTNACVVLPVELPGVIGVTATGSLPQDTAAGAEQDYLKSYYSSFGVSTADVAAPGGDFYFRGPDSGPFGLVLSTWPANIPCGRSMQEPPAPNPPTSVYCYLQGTSMASPHVAGVAALVISRFGDDQNAQNGHLRPGRVEQYLAQTADPQSCPRTLPVATSGSLAGTPYEAITGSQSDRVQQCQGGPGHNSWYGNGLVDALAAVTHDTSNNS